MPSQAKPFDLPPTPNVPNGLEVLGTYGDGFAGREAELAALHQAWNDGAIRVFVLHAQGGAGKTRVVTKWLTELRDAGWRGAGRVFVHSFYSQGNDQHRNASSEFFFEQALAHFGHLGPPLTDPTQKGRTLARLLIEQHGLLVLDGIEPLQQPPAFDQGRLKDPALQTLLVTMAGGRIGARRVADFVWSPHASPSWSSGTRPWGSGFGGVRGVPPPPPRVETLGSVPLPLRGKMIEVPEEAMLRILRSPTAIKA